MTKRGAVFYNETGAVAYRRLATSLRREVRPMGNGRWTKVLRFVVCFIIIFLMMVYISPKAC